MPKFEERNAKNTRLDWATPPGLVRALEVELAQPFALDLAARQDNAVCPLWLGPGSHYAVDTLATNLGEVLDMGLPPGLWGRWWWCNPPYGPGVRRWAAQWKMLVQRGARIVALVAARTDTQWFHSFGPDWVQEVRLLKGRIRFEGAPDAAKFPSALVFMARPSGSPAAELRITRGPVPFLSSASSGPGVRERVGGNRPPEHPAYAAVATKEEAEDSG